MGAAKLSIGEALAAAFTTPEHEAWKTDRALRRKIPLADAWRGHLGLAIMLHNVEQAIEHGDASILPATNLEFVAMRDVPVGHFPGSASMNRRDVNYASKGFATLKHGMPFVDLTGSRDAVDFKFMPFGSFDYKYGTNDWDKEKLSAHGDVLNSDHDPRLFDVLNRVSASLTSAAFNAVDHKGMPVRPAWHRRRAVKEKNVQLPRSHKFFPVAYTAFAEADFEQLYWLSTESEAGGSVHVCPHCGRGVETAQFKLARCRAEFFENGDFVAGCPHCGKRRKWFLDDSVPVRVKRRFSDPFRSGFCDSLAAGFPLKATIACKYLGVVRPDVDRDGEVTVHQAKDLDLVAHRFSHATAKTSSSWVIYLPAWTTPLCKEGQELAAGETWVQILDESRRFARMELEDQWKVLHDILGGSQYVGYAQQLWFQNQAIRSDEQPGIVLMPSDLVVTAARQLDIKGLWFDILPCANYLVGEDVILPPIRLRNWERLQLLLAGEVVFDARITDPRFSVAKCHVEARPAPRKPEVVRKASVPMQKAKLASQVRHGKPGELVFKCMAEAAISAEGKSDTRVAFDRAKYALELSRRPKQAAGQPNAAIAITSDEQFAISETAQAEKAAMVTVA